MLARGGRVDRGGRGDRGDRGDRGGHCDLCGLPLPQNPILREWDGDLRSDGEDRREAEQRTLREQRHFCCEGCARVYEVARENDLLEQVLQRTGAGQTPADAGEPASEAGASKARTAVRQPGESAYFSIEGMWCAGCALAAERVLSSQPGVKDVSVSFAAERGRIEYAPGQVDLEALMKQLAPLGYRVQITSTQEEKRKERYQNRIGLQLMAALAFGMEIMVLYLVQLYPMYAMGLYQTTEARRIQYVVWAMTTPVVFYGGLTFLVGAWRALKARTVGMDTLVAVGVLSAYFYSVYVTLTGSGQTYFDSASMIVDFILIGRYLEAAGGAQARKDLRSLLSLQPRKAWRRAEPGEDWQQVQVEALHAGDEILVKPGEHVPADARVSEGDATLDESLLTGESLPVTRRAGDTIFAGSLVREGALIGVVTQPPGSTRLSQIAALVTETLSQKPRVQRLADQASTYFAYAILFLAAATFAGWYLRSHSLATALMSAVAVLVVACPCALGLATPLAMTVTMGNAARKGILVRSPAALETSASIQRMVFDKTGTLTQGQLSVVEAAPYLAAPYLAATSPKARLSPPELLALAASVEQFSEHPLARAILQASRQPCLPASDFLSIRGTGVSARVHEHGYHGRISVGSARMVKSGLPPELQTAAQEREAKGETVVWVDRDGQLAGFIAMQDRPNTTARPALERLATQGITTAMLSGDSPRVAQAIAAELGIGTCEGGLSPEGKAAAISAWQREGLRVGMVGDGVNDAPALAQADLSITVAGGTDIAGQASDLVLTRPDLRLIPWFLQLSRRTRRTILQNLGWAFAYNLVSVPLAMAGLINPVIAAVAMAVSSLLVVVNSLRKS